MRQLSVPLVFILANGINDIRRRRVLHPSPNNPKHNVAPRETIRAGVKLLLEFTTQNFGFKYQFHVDARAGLAAGVGFGSLLAPR